MNIQHHIPTEILAAYTAGHLPEAFSLVVACHLSLCPTCGAEMQQLEAMGGDILSHSAAADLPEGMLEATLARIEKADGQNPEPQHSPAPPVSGPFPLPLHDYAGSDPDAVQWRAVGGGVKQCILPCSDDASARLLYIPAGMAVPDHSHNGLEMTLVLSGAFHDETAHFARGDVEIGDDDLHHAPIAHDDMPCICLAATEGPLKFDSLAARIIQPFINI